MEEKKCGDNIQCGNERLISHSKDLEIFQNTLKDTKHYLLLTKN